MCLGNNIRYLRTKRGYSQDYIAEQLGYKSFTTIQKWESGVSEPPLKALRQLATLFDVDIDDITSRKLYLEETRDTPDFKEMLKYYRMKAGLSQSELAEKLGLAASTISMYEVGKREPDFETEEKIADFFNTDLNTLRGRDIEENEHYYLNDDAREIAQSMSNEEIEHIKKYRAINNAGKKVVDIILDREYVLFTEANIPEEAETKRLNAYSNVLNAAHELPNATDENKQHDDDIMDDDNF